jgi:hypothetical protein
MDVVYRVRDNPKNEELRHSLRSLVNLPHDRVFVFGGPPWLRNVVRLPDPGGGKWAAIYACLGEAARHPDISDEFILVDDDQFVMQPLDSVPVLHRGPMQDIRYSSDTYVAARRRAYKYLVSRGIEAPLNYELHIPIVLNKDRVAVRDEELRRDRQSPMPFFRSVYGNLEGIGGERAHDVKYGLTREVPRPAIPFLSTNDQSFRLGYAGDRVRATFPEPSIYES